MAKKKVAPKARPGKAAKKAPAKKLATKKAPRRRPAADDDEPLLKGFFHDDGA